MKLTILDPGHFHAALVQKHMYATIDPDVDVYAPAGPDLDDYLRKIESYNVRGEAPTHWRVHTHTGADFLERFLAERRGDIVVLAGNNRRKTEYLLRCVEAGMHTLADKPMAIDPPGFEMLRRAFELARDNGVLLYDIMTERFEITTLLQKAFAALPEVFGELQRGSPDAPAVTKESVHYFSKLVSGAPLKRPAWFFDTTQQGEGLADITTHLVDLIQWECFPGVILDARRDVQIGGARRWPTELTLAQFAQVTQLGAFPEYLRNDVQANGSLHVYANGEINYKLRGVHAKVSVRWDFAAPPGGGDTHYSVLRGSTTDLVIRQGAAQGYQPVLAIEPVAGVDAAVVAAALERCLPRVQAVYPGVDVARTAAGWDVRVPAAYHVGHEAHFGQVTEQFLGYVARGALPDWEVPNMLAKYRTTTQAVALARS